MEFLTAALSAIRLVGTSPLALGAYAFTIAAYVFTALRVNRNKNLLVHLQKLPPKDRLAALKAEMGMVRLTKGLSPEQWLRSRIHQYYLIAFLASCIVVVAVLAFTVPVASAYVRELAAIKEEYRAKNGGEALSAADLAHIRELLNAAIISPDAARAEQAYGQLSERARLPAAQDQVARARQAAAGGLQPPVGPPSSANVAGQ